MSLPNYLLTYLAPNYENYKAWLQGEPVGSVMFYYVWPDKLEFRVSPEIARSFPPKMVPTRAEDRAGYTIVTGPRRRTKGFLMDRQLVQFHSMDGLLDALSRNYPTIPRASVRLIDCAVNYRKPYIPPGVDLTLNLDVGF
jgi:hypothetical protein